MKEKEKERAKPKEKLTRDLVLSFCEFEGLCLWDIKDVRKP